MNYKIEDYIAKAREAVAEGFVLLKNEKNILPLAKGTKLAVFGRTQFDYFKSGTGSGGLVNTSYVVNILDALLADTNITINENLKSTYEKWLESNPFDVGVGWATEPWFQKEMPITDEIVKSAKSESEVAIIIIGRTAGEDKDNKVEEGSYLLTEDEENILDKVCATFDKVVVLLNTGNIIDMNWVDKYKPSAVAYVWQGGQEGGNGCVDVLMGHVNPSGKLPNTIVYDVKDIYSTAGFGDRERAVYAEDIYVGYRYFETFAKEKVMYPFGFGLSYTNFEIKVKSFSTNNDILVELKNTGNHPGKEVVQVYVEAPQGLLGKPTRSLVGFAKTKILKPEETCEIKIAIPDYYLSSYDDSGITGYKSAYVLEAGEYNFYVGTDVRSAVKSYTKTYDKLVVVEQLTEAMSPIENFEILKPKFEDGKFVESKVSVSTRTINYDERIKKDLPKTFEITGDKGYKLSDVNNKKVTMEEFVAQFSKEDLSAIVRGEGMCSPKVTAGIAGAFGGVTDNLKNFGLPVAGCADGPSGIRMDCGTMAFAMPNGTLLASTFNLALCEELYQWEALELRKNKIDTLLGPGINIHRSPLNGRNFEYFSEDPILTGKMAVAQLRGMHKYNVTGTIKHFACNNQETNRHGVETIASERAIREIYLKGFELAVKEANAYSIMTSYNPINGYWSASNYDLLTVILRDEWKYDGIVMTDWWAKGNFTDGIGELKNTSAKAQSQNDLNMVNPNASDMNCDNSLESLNNGVVTVGEYQRSAINICNYLLRTPVYDRVVNGESELDKKLIELVFEGDEKISKTFEWYVDTENTIEGSEIAASKGDLNLIALSVKDRGNYSLSITCRANEKEGDLAQIPVTVIKDKDVIETITVVGSQKEWATYTINSFQPFYMNNCYLKLLFGQGGMEIKEIKFTLTENLEEQIKKAMGQ